MIITPRDRELFRQILNYGMLSTKHIKEIIFGGVATTTVLRRLRLLEEKRFIKRMLGLGNQEVLWINTDKAIQLTGSEQFKKYWNKNLLEHDFKLLNLRIKLEKYRIAKSWVPEHEVRHLIFKKYDLKIAQKKLVPDGIMVTETHQNEVSVAIELELNLKNKERIKETLIRYQDKKDLSLIWYICQNKTIAKSMLATWQGLSKADSSPKLICSYVEDVMKNPLEANLFNGKQKIKLGDVWKQQAAHPTAQGVSTQVTLGSPTPSEINHHNRRNYPVSNAPPGTCLHP